tara:strand:+ start:95 stop:748 length:654 start_codon:yes stop_codon:yes gene_type:complete
MSPKIVSIAVSPRSPSQAVIKFSDNSFLPLGLVSVHQLSLQKNQEISQSKLQKITRLSIKFLLKNYALRQIAISAKTEKMLQQKLQLFLQKILIKYHLSPQSYHQTSIQETLSYIKSRGLLRPQELVDYMLRKHKNKSFYYIKRLLQQKGVDPLLIPSSSSSHQEVVKIKRALNKKHIKTKDLADFKTKMKVSASLANQGFSYPDIKEAIDDLTNLS